MTADVKRPSWLLGLAGAVVGGAAGYFGFFLLAQQGLYAMVLPGAALGLGWGALSGGKSNVQGVVCGVLGGVLGLFTEWQFAPFVDDGSFRYFLTHLGDVSTMRLVLIAIGGLLGFWFGRGRAGGVWPRRSKITERPQ